jgi:hypothetical protein
MGVKRPVTLSTSPSHSRDIREHLRELLKAHYEFALHRPLPDRLATLVDRLTQDEEETVKLDSQTEE